MDHETADTVIIWSVCDINLRDLLVSWHIVDGVAFAIDRVMLGMLAVVQRESNRVYLLAVWTAGMYLRDTTLGELIDGS